MGPNILAIESSCDETSASIISNGKVLNNIIASQAIHQKYGGVVPELASRAHQQNIVTVVNEALQKALNLKYELLKLEKAVQQQGEEQKRQSETNKKEFNNTTNALPASLQEYIKSVEILNRQSLPLRSNYNQKVQEYFKAND